MRQLIRIFLTAVLFFSTQNIFAQAPTCQIEAKNFVLTAPNVFEFEIWLSRTGTTEFIYSTGQYAFSFNSEILQTDATLTMILVSGTSNFTTATRPATYLANAPFPGVIYLTAKIPTIDPEEYFILPVFPTEARLGKFRVTCSQPYVGLPLNLVWRDSLTGDPYTKLVWTDGAFVFELPHANFTYVMTGGDITVPVELSSFSALTQGRNVNLSWETKTELNSSSFEVERQAVVNNNATDWKSIGSVSANGTSTTPIEYIFTDSKLNSGKYNYRLKMIDNDGTFNYSDAVETEVALPKDYAISQNYPNPFNPTTRIDYQLPFDSKVTLELYGITGERVATLINSELSAGYYTADVNASALNLASGVYIYRMTAQNPTEKNFVQVKKLMLTK